MGYGKVNSWLFFGMSAGFVSVFETAAPEGAIQTVDADGMPEGIP
jgi:hypothetical protein